MRMLLVLWMMIGACNASAQLSDEEVQKKLEALNRRAADAPKVAATKPRDEAPTTQPTTKPAMLLALAEYKTGKYKECLATIKVFQDDLPKQVGKLSDPDWINSIHLQAVIYIKAGQFDRAAPAMERIAASGRSNRSIVINRSIVHLTRKREAIRAVLMLRDYAMAHPEDELVVNLWGTGLDIAAKNGGDVNDKIDDFVKVNELLEATRPGMRHWGTKWITKKEYDTIQRDRERALEEHERAMRDVADAHDSLRDAQRDFATDNAFNSGASRSQINSSLRSVQDAQKRLDRERANADKAATKIPVASWALKLEPVDPDFNLE